MNDSGKADDLEYYVTRICTELDKTFMKCIDALPNNLADGGLVKIVIAALGSFFGGEISMLFEDEKQAVWDNLRSLIDEAI